MFTILGCGSIGSLVAWACEKNKLDYQLILRPNPAKQLSHTLHCKPLDLAQGNVANKALLAAKTDQFKAQVYQYQTPIQTLIVPVKAYQVKNAIKQLAPYLAKNCTVILLHNGLGTVRWVKQYCPGAQIILATTTQAAFQPEPGLTIQTGIGETYFGPVQTSHQQADLPADSAINKLINAFKPAHWDQNIQLRLWQKLAINAVINPLTALANIKNGDLTQVQYLPIIKQLVNEFCEVSQLEGFRFEPENILNLVLTVASNTADNYSSMQQDIYHARATEIDYINGYLLKVAAKHQLALPQHQNLFEQIKQAEIN